MIHQRAQMNHFHIDQQTFNDLHIFSANGQSSIFDVFKGTRTLGGRTMLREMMHKPFSSIAEVTLRRDAIKYFREARITLKFKNEEVDLIEFYLKFDKRRSRSNIIDSVADYFTRNSSNDFYIIKVGLKYLIKLVKQLTTLIEEYGTGASGTVHHTFENMQEIMQQGVFQYASQLNENKLNFMQVNKLDQAIRGKQKENVRRLLDMVYELDIFENLALISTKLNLSFADYDSSDKMKVSLKGLFHITMVQPVKNDIEFEQDKNLIFLSGSNMAGKSSLLKSLGLVIYLAQLGFPVPADHMKTTLFNGLITTINLPDNMGEGLSHYYSEVKRVKEVSLKLLEADKLFIIFDELFRGTNVKDAFDASLLILSELTHIKDSAFFISTHIVELAVELAKFDNISFSYLETYFENQRPVFTYKLMQGISKERLGMYIVLNEGIVEILKKAVVKSVKIPIA